MTPGTTVFDRLQQHEQVVFCHDEPTGLRAIIAIHSTALGPALGGTRFYPYPDEDSALADVLELSRGMTYKAAAAGGKIRTLAAREKQGDFLRVAITGGGCNGLSYKLKFAAEPRRGDILVQTSGVPVVVDPKTALYLKGTVLDYSDAMVAGGFKFSNPNAKASCSCGESFSV